MGLINTKIYYAAILLNLCTQRCRVLTMAILLKTRAGLQTKQINPGAVNRTRDPSLHVSMPLLVIFFLYSTMSPTSRARNRNCFKSAKNPGVTIPDFTALVGMQSASKSPLCPLPLSTLSNKAYEEICQDTEE